MVDSTIEAALRADESGSETLAAQAPAKQTVFIVSSYSIERVFSTFEKAQDFRTKSAEPFFLIEHEIDGEQVY